MAKRGRSSTAVVAFLVLFLMVCVEIENGLAADDGIGLPTCCSIISLELCNPNKKADHGRCYTACQRGCPQGGICMKKVYGGVPRDVCYCYCDNH